MKRAIAIVALTAGAVLFGAAAPAQAHSFLVSSTPAEGSTLTSLPATFEVTMNEDLLDLVGDGTGFGIRVVDSEGLYYGDGMVTIAGDTLSTTAALGEAGEYTFIYQVVSADGHPVSDEFSFEWAPPEGFVPSEGADAPPGAAGETPEPVVEEAAPVDLAPVLWIGGAILAVLIAAGVTLLLVRPRK